MNDIFTFDSDLELTIGLPNYRPTAIRKILSRTHGGWGRQGASIAKSLTAKYEEIQPPL